MNPDAPPSAARSPIGLRRLVSQRIAGTIFTDAAAVASWLGAMQGQDYPGTKWAFGVRMPHSTAADIDRAIADRSVIRSWAMRGTLHCMAAADVHWIIDLVAARLITQTAQRRDQLELDDETMRRALSLVEDALAEGGEMTRAELFAYLELHGIECDSQRGYHIMMRAGLERLLFQGAMRGASSTFVALPSGATLPRDQAAALLARRYFISRGPVMLADFIAWSGLLTGEARAALEAIKPELVAETIDGQTYFFAPDALAPPDQSVYLLTGFDEYVLGYRERGAVLERRYADAICPGGNGVFMSTIVYHGHIVGTWRRTIKKATVEIALAPFQPLDAEALHGLTVAAARYGEFLGLTAKIIS